MPPKRSRDQLLSRDPNPPSSLEEYMGPRYAMGSQYFSRGLDDPFPGVPAVQPPASPGCNAFHGFHGDMNLQGNDHAAAPAHDQGYWIVQDSQLDQDNFMQYPPAAQHVPCAQNSPYNQYNPFMQDAPAIQHVGYAQNNRSNPYIAYDHDNAPNQVEHHQSQDEQSQNNDGQERNGKGEETEDKPPILCGHPDCSGKGKRYKHLTSLARHVKYTHNNLGPFRCEICGVTRTRPDMLEVHKRQKHGLEKKDRHNKKMDRRNKKDDGLGQ